MNDQYIKPIETVYKGYRFRSRLEARWAVFFDAIGVEWEYEKEGYELSGGIRYLPDFFLYIDKKHAPTWGTFIEIKAVEPSEDEREKLLLLHKGSGSDVMCFWGKPSENDWNVTTYENGKLHIENGKYIQADNNSDRWFVDIKRNKFSSIPFGYEWYTEDTATKYHLMKRAFRRAMSARFEFGEAG